MKRTRGPRRWMVTAGLTMIASVGPSAAGATSDAGAPFATEPPTGSAVGEDGGMWPQTTMDEVVAAQARADAGDADVAWQVDAALAGDGRPADAEIVVRFLREELGWESFQLGPGGYERPSEGMYQDVQLIRCAPGGVNPLYPSGAGSGCAPTLDETRYETIGLDMVQLTGADPSSIWVITRWALTDPVVQVPPAAEADVNDLLTGFLDARLSGGGAEAFLGASLDVPLLYGSSTGASYERFEILPLTDLGWPTGRWAATVALYADGGATVVEQRFDVVRSRDGGLGLTLGRGLPGGFGTTENGVGERYGFLDDELTFTAAAPWYLSPAGWHHSPTMTTLVSSLGDAQLTVIADPVPAGRRCEPGSADDAADVVNGLRRADLEVSELMSHELAGQPSSVVDVSPAVGGDVCDEGSVMLFTGEGLDVPLPRDHRAQVTVIDVFAGSVDTLAVVVIAPADDFDGALAAAGPVLDSMVLNPVGPEGAIPDGNAPIAAGRYRIPASPWEVADLTVSFPEGWHVQYGHLLRKYPDTDDEFGFYPVVVDQIYADACGPDRSTVDTGTSPEDLVEALVAQVGPEGRSHPARHDLRRPPRHPGRPPDPGRPRPDAVPPGRHRAPDLAPTVADQQVLRAHRCRTDVDVPRGRRRRTPGLRRLHPIRHDDGRLARDGGDPPVDPHRGLTAPAAGPSSRC